MQEQSEREVAKFQRALNASKKQSGFKLFSDRLTKELAPVSGQQVLHSSIKKAASNLKGVISSLNRHLELLLQSDGDFKTSEKFLMDGLESLGKAVREKVPELLKDFKKGFKEDLKNGVVIPGSRVRGKGEYKNDLEVILDSSLLEIENRNKTFVDDLHDAPTGEELKEKVYLSKVKGSKYWETTPKQAEKLRNQMQSYVEEQVACRNNDFVTEGQALIKLKAKQLAASLMNEIKKV